MAINFCKTLLEVRIFTFDTTEAKVRPDHFHLSNPLRKYWSLLKWITQFVLEEYRLQILSSWEDISYSLKYIVHTHPILIASITRTNIRPLWESLSQVIVESTAYERCALTHTFDKRFLIPEGILLTLFWT